MENKTTRKLLGSETFGTSTVRTDEYILLAIAMKENGQTDASEIAKDIEMIDDMLSMARIACLSKAISKTKSGIFRKDVQYSAFLENRIQARIDQ